VQGHQIRSHVAAERQIDSAIVTRLDEAMKARLDGLLTEMVEGNVSRLVGLRQFEVGQNSADVIRLLHRLASYLAAQNGIAIWMRMGEMGTGSGQWRCYSICATRSAPAISGYPTSGATGI